MFLGEVDFHRTTRDYSTRLTAVEWIDRRKYKKGGSRVYQFSSSAKKNTDDGLPRGSRIKRKKAKKESMCVKEEEWSEE